MSADPLFGHVDWLALLAVLFSLLGGSFFASGVFVLGAMWIAIGIAAVLSDNAHPVAIDWLLTFLGYFVASLIILGSIWAVRVMLHLP
jgi:hypothetical protein